MIDRNFPSQYDDNGNKILPNGFLPDDDNAFDFDFHDGGSNRESDDFHFDLEDDNSIAICDTCPNTKEFEKYRNDTTTEYFYDPVTKKVGILLEEVLVGNNKTAAVSSAFFFWINLGIGTGGVISGYYGKTHLQNELWHKTKTRGVSNIFQKRWRNSFAKKWRKTQTNQLRVSRNVGTILSGLTIVSTTYSVIDNQNIKTSDVLNVALSALAIGIPGLGTTIAGVYFLADLATMGGSYLLTGKPTSIGTYIDQHIEQSTGKKDGALIDWR